MFLIQKKRTINASWHTVTRNKKKLRFDSLNDAINECDKMYSLEPNNYYQVINTEINKVEYTISN